MSGLTTGICLARAGARVRIRSDRRPADTTSARAGALWAPLYAEHPDMPRWCDVSYEVLAKLAATADAGVRMIPGVEAARTPAAIPDWPRVLPGFRAYGPGDLPEGFASGFGYLAPVVDMPVYLPWLAGQFRDAGGELLFGDRLARVEDGFAEAPVVVNCTGLGARELIGDDTLTGARGQMVVVRNPGVHEFFAEIPTGDRELTYLIPQGDLLLLGGSADRGTSPEPDPAIERGILRRCAAVQPLVAGAEIIGRRVGFRPMRPQVRVEVERLPAGPVVHNYGHSGAGVSLSWGCADDVAGLVRGLLA